MEPFRPAPTFAVVSSGFMLGTRRADSLAVAVAGTMVLMPSPWKPEPMPTISRVGRYHLGGDRGARIRGGRGKSGVGQEVLMPSPWKPEPMPAISRVGRYHLGRGDRGARIRVGKGQERGRTGGADAFPLEALVHARYLKGRAAPPGWG